MAGFSAETQQLLIRVLADTSQAQASLKQLQGTLGTLASGAEASAAKAGQKAGQSYASAFNKGIGKNRFVDIGATVAGGGLKFLERTVLATAAAGTILELQFLRVQDAQAAMARTLEGESAPALAKLNQEILDLSKTIPVSVTELYRIGEVGGTIGIASDSVAHFTDVVAKMAATTDLGVDEAAMGIGRLLNIFGFVDEKGQAVADQADNIASAMVKLSISQASTDQEILLATERFGALATSMGLLPAQILAISSTAAALGQRPEAIGGSIQRIFQTMNRAVAEGGDKLKQFGEISGLTAKQFRDLVREDPFTAFTKFLEGFGKLTPEQQSLLFGSGKLFPSFVRGQQTLQGLAARVDLLKTAATAAQVEYDRGKLLDEQAAVRFNTIKNNLVLLGNAITRGAVAFGSAFDEELGGAIQKVTQYITDNEAKFEEWGQNVGKFIKSIDWEQVKQFAQDFFGVFATGVRLTGDILDRLPPKFVGIIALLKTINALSGGGLFDLVKLVSSGGAAVIKLAFDQFVGRGSNPANPIWVAMIGGPVGTGSAIDKVLTAVVSTLGVTITTAIGAGFALVLSQLPKFFDETLHGTNTTQPQQQSFAFSLGGPLQDLIYTLLGRNPRNPVPAPITGISGPFGSDLNAQRAANELALLADYGRTEADLARQIADNTGGTELGIAALTAANRKFLDALRPRHREGEKGKSLQSAEFRFLENVDPSKTDKITTALADLIKHYTDQPIGTKGHERGFVIPAFKGIFDDLQRALKRAMARGDEGGVSKLVAQLKGLKDIGVHLPAGLRRLIREAEKGHAETKHAIDAEKRKLAGGIETQAERIAMLRRTLQQKKLAVSYKGGPIRVNTGRVTVGPTYVRASIGTRSIVRATQRTVAYGPGYTYEGTGTYSLYGDNPT